MPVNPVAFHMGPITIRWYGIMILAGFTVALLFLMREAAWRIGRRKETDPPMITPDEVLDASLVGLVLGIIGTRVVYVALDWPDFAQRPLEAFNFWSGGLSFIGAPIFGFGYLYWFCRRHGYSFLGTADMVAPAFAVAYSIGRIGCFLNGCCFGGHCDLPWRTVFFKDGDVSVLTPPSHPTQLYATIINLCIFAYLARRLRSPHAPGAVFVTYMLLYAIYRGIIEQFRKGATADVAMLGLTLGQVIAIVVIPLVAVALAYLNRRWRQAASAESPGSSAP